MINRKKRKIIKNSIKNAVIIKYYYRNLINKSIETNKNIEKKKNLLSKYLNKKNIQNTNTKKICLISGKSKNINKKILLSRHNLNYLASKGELSNFKLC